jgi:hypothetical protein
MSELLLPPEHRYAKIMKEKLNEDGRTFHIELLLTRYARDFPKRFIDGRGTYFRSRTNHWLHTRALLKNCRKPTFTK